MSTHVLYVTPETTMEECMAIMINKFIRHLPVLDAHRVVGVVSIGDVVKSCLEEREFVIDELTRYITDSPVVMQSNIFEYEYQFMQGGVAATPQ